MYPVSDAFKAAVIKSHRIVTKAEVYDQGVLAATLKATEAYITADRTAEIRRRCTARLVDDTGDLTPADAKDLLAPVGNELRLFRGIALSTGDELVPLGVFNFGKTRVQNTGEGVTIELEGFDRSRKVARARFKDTYVVASGTNYSVAIQDIVAGGYPGVTFNFMGTEKTTPRLVFERGQDRWRDAAVKMAESLGAEIFFDPDGVCVLQPEPDPLTSPVVWTYNSTQATILSLDKDMDDENISNHIVVTGESTDNAAPVLAEAMDTDPGSPTYVGGDFGDVVEFMSSPFITTTTQAQDAADAKLLRSLGLIEDVHFNAIVNPAHAEGDVVEIVNDLMKVDARYLIEKLSFSLGTQQAMDASTKRRQVA